MMTGVQVEEITEAISNAYTWDTLRRMLRTRLDKRLEQFVEEGPLTTVAFDLFDVAEREGWEVDLVREAHRFNPGNAEMLAVYEKYGLSPKIDIQTAGAKAEVESTKASSEGFERTVNRLNPLLDIERFRRRLTDFEMRVARIAINGDAAGTGFLVGSQAILTNYHVVEDIIAGKLSESSITCMFDYKVLANGTVSSSLPVKLSSAKGILAWSPYSNFERIKQPDKGDPTPGELDFALLCLDHAVGQEPAAVPGSPPRGWEILPDAPVTFTVDQGLIIVQHPVGLPMKVAIDTSAVIGVNSNGTRVRYRTNTEGGSSGSMVLDLQCNLVALHHYGDPLHDDAQWNQGVIQLQEIRKSIVAAGAGAFLGNPT